MATRPVETGPTGERVAANIAKIRRQRGWDQRKLADRMTEVGRPMRASVISKIEKGDRRVDVDDLVALARALKVSPVTLMLPGRDEREPVPLLPGETVSWQGAWRWMHASAPPPEDVREDDFIGLLNWLAENRPYLSEGEFRRQHPGVHEKAADQFMDTDTREEEEGEEDGPGS
ncbi:helix-turn-helix transcriptional regulator [Streptomyces sp. MB09-02B]|uniref:helix-turn-helix domain-containing protein n=1 Tax=Streptomyces sp. MB09-02B TaxID=3028667 RepID=UPI0029ABD41B|nr:helix-turn-helix transcriptional regulator [Streptomyces sp. MB09-02B]MDX3641434.1 helix-turn-helix transcriptional regulator [Streptomyces sp. MB09-02B]